MARPGVDLIVGVAGAPTTICRLLAVPEGPPGLAAAYSPAQGTFKPPPQMPRKHRPLDARVALKLAQSLPSIAGVACPSAAQLSV